MKIVSGFVSTAMFVLMASPSEGLILYGHGNADNLTDPGTGAPFDSVAKVSFADGSSTTGSALYIGNGYMLTANHVNMRPYVTFDGVSYYQVDNTYSPTQVATGVDMKVFRLTTVPTVAAVEIYTGSSEIMNSSATLVGWGVGRNPATPINTASVPWGTDSNKRWGLNNPEAVVTVNSPPYNYSAIVTQLGTDQGADEAAATLNDSGSGLFQFLDGSWQLIGLTTGVESSGTSLFGTDTFDSVNSHYNVFVRVSDYHQDINALIIPEPSSAFLLFLTSPLVLRRKR